MKIQRGIRWISIVSLGLFGLTCLGIACWLYAWRWSGTPEPHDSLPAHEVRLLREYDDFLVSTAVAHERMELSHWWKENELDHPDSWLVKLSITLAADWISKRRHAPHRGHIHSLLLNNTAQQINTGLAFHALCKKDGPLFKMLVDKVSDTTSPHEMGALLYRVAFFVPSASPCLPVEDRLALMDWLHEQKDAVCSLPPHRVLEAARLSLMYSDDKAGAILDWFLRKGCKLNPEETLALLLSQPEALPTLQKLIADGLLPAPPQTLAPYLECSPLQLVAGQTMPAPDTVRWLLTSGHSVHGKAAASSASHELPGFCLLSPLDACVQAMQYLSLESTAAAGHLEVLSLLLQQGAVPSAGTKDLLPMFDAGLRSRIVSLMEQHGYYILSGENSCNACCQPE